MVFRCSRCKQEMGPSQSASIVQATMPAAQPVVANLPMVQPAVAKTPVGQTTVPIMPKIPMSLLQIPVSQPPAVPGGQWMGVPAPPTMGSEVGSPISQTSSLQFNDLGSDPGIRLYGPGDAPSPSLSTLETPPLTTWATEQGQKM